jgi:hypothetical protein
MEQRTSTATTAVLRHLLELRRNGLFGLAKEAHQVTRLLGVIGGEVGIGNTLLASTL